MTAILYNAEITLFNIRVQLNEIVGFLKVELG